MKLTDLFQRDRKHADRHTDIAASARGGSDAADRSSMADLVRLLREADEGQKGGGQRRA